MVNICVTVNAYLHIYKCQIRGQRQSNATNNLFTQNTLDVHSPSASSCACYLSSPSLFVVLLFRGMASLRLWLANSKPVLHSCATGCRTAAGLARLGLREEGRTAVNPQTALLPPQLVPSHLSWLFSSLGGVLL